MSCMPGDLQLLKGRQPFGVHVRKAWARFTAKSMASALEHIQNKNSHRQENETEKEKSLPSILHILHAHVKGLV